MLKKTITYHGCDGEEYTEDFFFHLSKAELMEMELGTEGGLTGSVNKIVSAKDRPELIRVFKNIILKSYGEKSADGKRFVKSDEISTAFSQTEAYSILFMELAGSDEAAAKFVNGIMPDDVAKKASQAQLSVAPNS